MAIVVHNVFKAGRDGAGLHLVSLPVAGGMFQAAYQRHRVFASLGFVSIYCGVHSPLVPVGEDTK